MKLTTLNDLYLRTIHDVFYAEKEVLRASEDLEKKATQKDLKSAMKKHKDDVTARLKRLEVVMSTLKLKANAHHAAGIEGLLKEAKSLADEISDDDTRDAALLASLQEIEHYGINRYGTLIAWAETLGQKETARSLQESLATAKDFDHTLSKMATSKLNRQAAI
ncbi:MAG: ferritin-like domain-containing protein [Hyphomicrobiales bacterium]